MRMMTELNRKTLFSYIRWVLVTMLVISLFFHFFMLARVKGESMAPGYHDGDRVLVSRFYYDLQAPEYNDLVIIQYTSSNLAAPSLMIKRVVGLPGDHLEFRDGKLYRNEVLVEEPYLLDQDVTFPDRHVIVLEGEVFVMGDNRENSIDSRHFGCIDIQSQIIGKVIWKLF